MEDGGIFGLMIWLLGGPHEDINHFWAIKFDTWTWDISTPLAEIIFNLNCQRGSINTGLSVTEANTLNTQNQVFASEIVFFCLSACDIKEKHAAPKNLLLRRRHTPPSPSGTEGVQMKRARRRIRPFVSDVMSHLLLAAQRTPIDLFSSALHSYWSAPNYDECLTWRHVKSGQMGPGGSHLSHPPLCNLCTIA